jgi:hypothetical protein
MILCGNLNLRIRSRILIQDSNPKLFFMKPVFGSVHDKSETLVLIVINIVANFPTNFP